MQFIPSSPEQQTKIFKILTVVMMVRRFAVSFLIVADHGHFQRLVVPANDYGVRGRDRRLVGCRVAKSQSVDFCMICESGQEC